MFWKDTIKASSLYSLWRAHRERQQCELFEDRLRETGDARPYGEQDLVGKLKHHAVVRRPIAGHVNVVAFGTKDWEQYGLWPACESLGTFGLFDYAPLVRSRSGRGGALRRELARAFMQFLNEREREHGDVQLVFFYSAGSAIDPEMIRQLSTRGIWTVAMALDDKQQQPGPRWEGLEGWQLDVAQAVDVYWTTWRGGVDWLAARGVNAWYAPEGADPGLFRPLPIAKSLDVLWLGRAYGARLELVDTLRRCGLAVHAAGPGWPGGLVPFDEMIKTVSRSKIVLGMGGVGQTDRVKHLKGRDFEMPMCGAAYLTSFNPELTDFFDVGREILCYGSPQECADVVRWALARQHVLAAVREAGRTRCVRDHTWHRRLEQLMGFLAPSMWSAAGASQG